MAIEVEFFGLTGIIGPNPPYQDGLLLRHAPSTGPNGQYDVAVDPTDGPAQRLGIDFGVTHADYNAGGATGVLALNLEDSDIKDVLNNWERHGVTGILNLRVLYNYVE